MTAPVPLRPPQIVPAQALTARAVRGPTFEDIVAATHWALGRGAQLITAGSSLATTLDAAVEYIWNFRTKPRYQAYARLWILNLRSDDVAGDSVTIKTPSGGSSETYTVTNSGRLLRPIFHYEYLSAQSDAEATISLAITAAANPLWVDSIACVELPRPSLSVSSILSDLGIPIERARAGAPIWSDSGASDVGLYRIAAALDASADIGRRVAHLSWAAPISRAGVEIATFSRNTTAASGSPDTFFRVAPPFLARPGARGAAGYGPDKLKWKVLAKATDGTTTGRVDITMTNGATAFASIAAGTSYAMHTSNSDLTVDGEDQTASDGRDSATWDDATITFHRAAGAGTVNVAGLFFWEA